MKKKNIWRPVRAYTNTLTLKWLHLTLRKKNKKKQLAAQESEIKVTPNQDAPNQDDFFEYMYHTEEVRVAGRGDMREKALARLKGWKDKPSESRRHTNTCDFPTCDSFEEDMTHPKFRG